MTIRPYLTFNGQCDDAINVYTKAFNIKEKQVMKFSDMPVNPNFSLPEEFMDRVCQATLTFGDTFIRMSDCGPGQELNDADTHKICIAFEGSVAEVQNAYSVLTDEGTVGIELQEAFFSPCYGVVFDKFGIMWNLVSQK